VVGYALWFFVCSKVSSRDVGNFEMTGEQGICLMAAQPNRDSTLIWHKSSASGGDGACVEVAKSGSCVLVRDSRDRSGAVLVLTRAQWLGLLRHIKNGR
jgi:Domain of unknown function (DUF397)